MYAAELNALHLEQHVAWIYKYNYKGPKEKVRQGKLAAIHHLPTSTKVHIRDLDSGYVERYYLSFDTEIIIKEETNAH
jgi:hypothetical protein